MQGADHVYDFFECSVVVWPRNQAKKNVSLGLISDPNDNFRMTFSSFTSDGATKALN